MSSSEYRFSLDMHSAQSQISIPVLYGDTMRKFLIALSDGGELFTIEDGCLAKISIKRPTGTRLEAFCAIKNNTTIVYDFSQNENTAIVEGIHDCDVTLYDIENRVITSPRFSMVVSERVINNDDITITDSDVTAVDAMVLAEAERQFAEAARTAAEGERVQTEESRKYAEGQRELAEGNRSAAENDRFLNEEFRKGAENARAVAEDVRIASEYERVSNENIRVSKDSQRDASIQNALDTSDRAEENSENALYKANRATEDVADIKAEFGSEALIIGDKTVKGAVNHAVSTASAAKEQSDTVRTNLINLSAQVQGIGRSYVVSDFLSFINFLNSRNSIELKEDRNGDGVDETYHVYISDLKTGDNILIVEDGVPDFWFEKNSALSGFDTYNHNGTEYTLSATVSGSTIGGAHILETDYTVIEGYSLSASASAQDARESALEAKEAKEAAEVAQSEAERATSLATTEAERAKVYAQEAKATAQQMANDTQAIDALITTNSKRITNLEQGLVPDPFETDDSVAYMKDVPVNTLPYAEIQKIGGMTRKCKNVVKYPYSFTDGTNAGITYTKQTDGGIRLEGASTASGNVDIVLNPDAKLIAGTYTISTVPNAILCVIAFVGSTWKADLGNSNTKPTFTLTQADIDNYTIRVILRIPTGTTTNVTVYPMVSAGSVALPYEPCFEGLRSAPVTEVVSVGANLFDQDAWLVQNGAIPQSDGSYKCNAINKVCFVNEQRISGSVFVSVDYKTDSAKNPFVFRVFYTDGFNNYPTSSTQTTSFKKMSFASDPNRTVDYIVWTFGSIADYYAKNAMISFIDMDYTPYKEPDTLPIPEAVQALDGYGWGVNDSVYNYIDWESNRFVKRVGRVDLGTLNWEYEDEYHRFMAGSITNKKSDTRSATCLSAPYVAYFNSESLDQVADKGMYFAGGMLYVHDSAYTDAETLKAALSGVMLYYELATPEVTDIPDLITADNFIGVEPYGTLTFENEHHYDVPSTITYQLKGVSV